MSLEDRGVSGGDICDCEVTDWPPLDDDCRVCLEALLRDRLGDLWMFNGATMALACLLVSSVSRMRSAIADCKNEVLMLAEA